MNEITSKISRRDFLKLTALVTGTAALTLLKKEGKESRPETHLKYGALRIESIYREDGASHALRVLKILEESLRDGNFDLMITPEFSFDITWSNNTFSEIKHASLKLDQTGKKSFEINKEETHPLARYLLEEGRGLAQKYRTNLFLATFDYRDTEREPTAGVFIDNHGVITGLKRKYMPPLGTFEIRRGKNRTKILPIICGEAWGGYGPNGKEGSYASEWVKNNAPFDILTHSMRQADLDFNSLGKVVYGKVGVKDKELYQSDREEWMRDVFRDYYYDYSPFLKPNAPLLIADSDMAAAFDIGLGKIPSYQDCGDYVSGKLDLVK